MGMNRTEEAIIRSLADLDLVECDWSESLRTLDYQAPYLAYIFGSHDVLTWTARIVLLYPHWMVGGEDTNSSRLTGVWIERAAVGASQ